MTKVLIPVDGSPNVLHAVRRVIHESDRALELHLLHVRRPFSSYIARFLNRHDLNTYHREQAEQAARPVREWLDRLAVPYQYHVEIGDTAKSINRVAERLGVDRIVMAMTRQSPFAHLIGDSVTNRVLERAQVPVEVVAGDGGAHLERYVIPAGIGAAIALLLLAAD